jgi:hypothetical protein
MLKKGIYRQGKIHTHEPIVNSLTRGSWTKGWSGTKSFGGYTTYDYDIDKNMNWWVVSNQEVSFTIENGNVIIESLGKILSPEEADGYCRSF